jgi:hypothetical protein
VLEQITIRKEFAGQKILVDCLVDMRELSVNGYGSGPRHKRACLWLRFIKTEDGQAVFFRRLPRPLQGKLKNELMEKDFHYQFAKEGKFRGCRAVVVKQDKSLR